MSEKMTLSVHKEMGRTLQDDRNDLVAKSVELDRAGRSSLSKKLVKAVDLIDGVRSQLEEILFEEYPDIEVKDRYYYCCADGILEKR